MKSGLWLVGIFLFGILAMAALFVFNAFLLVFQLYPLPLVISVLAAAGSERLFGKLRRKYGFSAWVFWILAFLPHVIIGTGAVAAIYVELKMDIILCMRLRWACHTVYPARYSHTCRLKS